MGSGRVHSSWRGFLPDRAIVMARPAVAQPVVAELPAQACPRIVFVGESLDEAQPAGQLLGKMIEAMGLRREEVAVVEVGGLEASITGGSLWSGRAPEVLIALGDTAARALLGPRAEAVRGRWAESGGIRVMPTHAPSRLLQSPELKREVWEDLKSVASALGLQIPGRGSGSAKR